MRQKHSKTMKRAGGETQKMSVYNNDAFLENIIKKLKGKNQNFGFYLGQK